MAQACSYAQDHIDDKEAWPTDVGFREDNLQCVSYQMACFLAQNTVDGRNGVEWSVVIDELTDHPKKPVHEWEAILQKHVDDLGGRKKPQVCPATRKAKGRR